MRTITNSAVRCYRRCARQYQLKYALGYRPIAESTALRFGSATHLGLEQIERCTGLDLQEYADDLDPFDLVRVEELLTGYVARWGHFDEVLAVEAEFAAPLVNPATGHPSRTWRVAGKIDAIARVDGEVVIVEHKTSAADISPGSDYWRQLRLDPQISTYFAGARTLGYDVTSCLYDVLGKPALRPRLATPPEKRKYTKTTGELYKTQRAEDETPEEYRQRVSEAIIADPDRYYQRGTVVRLETEEHDAAHDLWQTARAIRESELADRWPRNSDACIRYGTTCPFWDVCTGCASLDDEFLYRKTDTPHEELTTEAA